MSNVFLFATHIDFRGFSLRGLMFVHQLRMTSVFEREKLNRRIESILAMDLTKDERLFIAKVVSLEFGNPYRYSKMLYDRGDLESFCIESQTYGLWPHIDEDLIKICSVAIRE